MSAFRGKKQFTARKRSYMDRQVDRVDGRKSFLIVCEGEKTEPGYFERFRVPTLVIRIVGTGKNPATVVKEALRLRAEENDAYDQVWCVFDKDDNPCDAFDNAIHQAVERGLYVAYSNQSFELWYLLHYDYFNTALARQEYMDRLSGYIGKKYEKNDTAIHGILKARVTTAVRNAERLLTQYDPPHPGQDDPSTTVHRLVTTLLKEARPLR